MNENQNNQNKKPAPISKLKTKKLIAFGWYGGKFSHLNWLLPLLPKCHHYCEPFAGSGAVILNRNPSPVETYNDLDGEVVNFFKVLRSEKEKLIEAIALTPFSREEFSIACQLDPNTTDLERARRFFVRARQVRTGLAQKATIGRWATCKTHSRSGMSGGVSRWLNASPKLLPICDRLLKIQIENQPATYTILKYDHKNTLFYCDPPYIHSSRADTNVYYHEMNNQEHKELAKILNSIKAMVAISYYDHPLINELYPPHSWKKTINPPKTTPSNKKQKQEILLTNYNPY